MTVARTCQCGCGQPVGVAKQSRTKLGIVKGQPLRYRNGHGHPGRRQETCRNCSTPFFPKCRKAGRQPQFCSLKCWAAFQPDRRCIRCRINLVSKGWAKHCSSCRADLERAHNIRTEFRRRLAVAFERLAGTECKGCGQRFMPRPGERARKFCSYPCSHRHFALHHIDLRRTPGDIDPALTTIHSIGERDGWVCHICRKKVKRNDASRDHLIPVAHGGRTTPENLALAHLDCNRRMNVARFPAQLRLVG